MTIVSLDPGIRVCGLAVYDNTDLRHAALVKSNADTKVKGIEAWMLMGWALFRYVQTFLPVSRDSWDRLIYVAEIPQTYQGKGRAAKVDLDDLLGLAAVTSAFATHLSQQPGGLAEIVSYHPHDWKGSLPWEIKMERVKKKIGMRPDELNRIILPPGRKKGSVGVAEHNVWDGIGIGMNYLETKGLR